MSTRTTPMTDRLYDYCRGTFLHEPPVLRRLREHTARMPEANMQITPEQGQFMAFLAQTIEARFALEIGTFTGASALWVALALPADGKLVACDISKEWTGIAQRFWREAGVSERIELRLGPARETLVRLRAEGRSGSFDFAFIDADKTSYDAYYEATLDLLRPGGIVAIDNIFWDGRVADPAETDPDTQAIRALNAKLGRDPRIALSVVPIGDGLALATRRG